MNERIERKVLDEWFFPVIFGESGLSVIVAPPDAVDRYSFLKNTWQKDYLRVNNETPVVRMFPTEKDGKKYYVVRTELRSLKKF